MRKSSRKLSLARQTLRTLSSDELAQQVRGGIIKVATDVNGNCGAQENSQTENKPVPVPQTIKDALDDMKPKVLVAQTPVP
jgi:hypothetical protein